MPRSLPALVAGILQSDKAWHVRSDGAFIDRASLVPAYHVPDGLPVEEQAQRVAQIVAELALKLSRLPEAFANWPLFEAGPYFDLYPEHAARLCRVEETRHVVRVRVYADLLLPAFRAAEQFWVESFLPAYHAGFDNPADDVFYQHLVEQAMPQLAELLDTAEAAIQQTLDLLSSGVDVLALLGGLEERIQHRPAPGTTLAPGLPPSLQRLPREVSTLTLDIIFPRPNLRPPGQEAWLRHQVQQTER